MIQLWPDRRFRFAVVGIMVLIGGAASTYYFFHAPTTNRTAQLGDLHVPEGEDPARVQLVQPTEAIASSSEDIPGDGVDDEAWREPGNSESVPFLIRDLKSEDEVVQCMALAEFAGMGAKAKAAVPAILEASSDPKSRIRLAAATTLIQMNFQTTAAVRVLEKELKANDATSRARATETIRDLVDPPKTMGTSCWEPDPPPHIARPWVGKLTFATLVDMRLHDSDATVRAAATTALDGLFRFATVNHE